MKAKKYRTGVGIILLNKDSKVFVGKRFDSSSEAWQLPQGGVDEGEDLLAAAWREMEEEIGTINAEFIHESNKWYYYDIPAEIHKNLWSGKYVGQKQKWFIFKFLGDDIEININTAIPEFQEWQWIDVEILPTIIVDFKERLYKELVNDLRHVIATIKWDDSVIIAD